MMAKRRRLNPMEISTPEASTAGLETKSAAGAMPPIARVAGESAGGGERALAMADAAGRLVHAVPISRIYVAHLARDRMRASAEGMEALRASILQHGQRMPVEIMPRGAEEEEAGRFPFGLISGMRRITALMDLAREHPDDPRFATVKAFIRQPDDLRAAYVAMVEENEIREDVSHYERARVALAAARAGVFDSVEEAVDVLYAAGSKARRSKIRTFVSIVETLGEVLVWPQAIGERLGLRVAQGIREGRGRRLYRAVETGDFEDADGQNAVLEAALKDRGRDRGRNGATAVSRAKPGQGDGSGDGEVSRAKPLVTRDLPNGARVEMRAGAGLSRLDIAGHALTPDQAERLADALAEILSQGD